MSTTEGIKEGIWLRRFICSLDVKVEKPILYIDSQSVLSLEMNLVYHKKITHIDFKLKFIRDITNEDRFSKLNIDNKENPKNMLTNSLPQRSSNFLRTWLISVEV